MFETETPQSDTNLKCIVMGLKQSQTITGDDTPLFPASRGHTFVALSVLKW